jgi:hypothetical protein
MDINALMGAAQSDPRLAQFLQQATQGVQAGGGGPQEIMAQMAKLIGSAKPPQFGQFTEDAPLPVFDPANTALDELFAKYGPQAATPAANPGEMQGPPMPPPPPGPIFGQPPQAAPPPGPPITMETLPPPGQMGDVDLLQMLQQALSGGGARMGGPQ